MPDLITHTAMVYVLVRPWWRQSVRVLFYIGALLPDVLSRPFYILWPALSPFTVALHTPIFVLLFVLFIAQWFTAPLRPLVRATLLSGCALHFLLDIFQKHIDGGYLLLFPFSWRFTDFGLFWPEATTQFAPWLLVVIIVIEGIWTLGQKQLWRRP
jgi:hypothetical protein